MSFQFPQPSSIRLDQQQNVDSLPPPAAEQVSWQRLNAAALPRQGNVDAHTPYNHLGLNQFGTAEPWELYPSLKFPLQPHQEDRNQDPYHSYSLGQMGLRAQRRYGISSAGLRQRWAL